MNSRQVRRTVEFRLTASVRRRQRFSHGRSKFPSGGLAKGCVAQKGVGELKSHQMVAFRVGYTYGSGAQGTGGFGEGVGGS
jgi:hypothetical protein